MEQLVEKDIAWRSHWLQQALAVEADLAPPLEGSTTADICIVGGGFLGLWTAIRLKQADPGADVMILERDICGGGPSGRNSGMLLSAWTKFSALAALRGEDEALSIVRQSTEAIDGIEKFCRDHGIDCWFDGSAGSGGRPARRSLAPGTMRSTSLPGTTIGPPARCPAKRSPASPARGAISLACWTRRRQRSTPAFWCVASGESRSSSACASTRNPQ